MVFLKAMIQALSVVIVGLFVFMVATYNHEYEIKEALSLFLQGNNGGAAAIVAKVAGDIPVAQEQLYGSYLARANGDIEDSNRLLEDAEAAVEAKESLLAYEITLNKAFNAYLANNRDDLLKTVSDAERYKGSDGGWVALFQGLCSYMSGDYTAALASWKTTTLPAPLSPWMGKAFGSTFDASWLPAHIARSMIAEGHFIEARSLLEKESDAFRGISLELINLAIGFSYLKEAEDKPLLARTPYYRLALSYFGKLPLDHERYNSDRNAIVKAFSLQAQALADDNADNTFYVAALQRWNSK